MSQNNWETQPRLINGEFTFRNHSKFIEKALERIHQEARENAIKNTIKGGSYGFLRNIIKANKNYEIHHMPADSASILSRWKGPCIIMVKEDHKKTSSYGRSKKADQYRKWQAKLISEGKFLEAERMDIKNIVRNFGNRYDKAIGEKLEYETELIKTGVING